MENSSPRRFYKEADVFEDAAGFGVALDGRALKTPSAADFRAPWRSLAKACAHEWAAQGERILPHTMPLTQWAFAAIDHTPMRRDELIAHVVKYGETDLCCHRADQPAGLAARQAAAWDPLLAWARAELRLDLPVVAGVIAACVESAATERLTHVATSQDDFRLTALAHATGLSGSAIIALALTYGVLDGGRACEAAVVDEHWSLERWGEDAEARARIEATRAEFDALARFISALA